MQNSRKLSIKMAKSTKRFIISTSALNSQGFRLLTSGAVLDSFNKNPLLLWNHQRPSGNSTDQVLPIGHWEDIEINGDEISGVPVFDKTDDFAMKIFNKVENGTIKMASAGAKILETSDDPKLILPGQTKETATKWELLEASICDIGSNPESLVVALYDNSETIITLSNSLITPLKMTDPEKKVETTDTEKQELAKLNETIKNLEEENKKLKEQIEASAKLAETEKIANLVNTAISERKFTEAEKPHYEKLAAADFETTKALIASLQSDVSLENRFSQNTQKEAAATARVEELSKKSGDELFMTPGAFAYLKEHSPEVYKLKYKEKFGVEPRDLK